MQQAAPNVEELFFAALELEGPEARSAFLDRACGDTELRRRVERAPRPSTPEASDFLEAPASMPTVTAAHDSRSGVEEPGTVIGPYKLLEAIGEGGMGTVYMAEQAEPVRRRVALKVIKPGMDSKQVVARFEAERQALAMMDHPNIAKVLDAGMTPSGRPYFVMELVRGLPITEYCDREQLSIPERLELFVLVCRAVQHAHQKGVIHRDLKPSNVLVTVIDGVAVPKVIDFGVAKATGQALTDKTLFTGFHQFVGTPLYMSPEQAELSGVDVDTRSDIYSLGVLLYELLTGTTPFDSETLKRAAFDEMRRIIREEEPPKPSTRLSSLGERLSTVSAQPEGRPQAARAVHEGRARLGGDEGPGEGPPAALRDGQRLRRRRDAVPDRPAGRGVPAVGLVSVREVRPPQPRGPRHRGRGWLRPRPGRRRPGGRPTRVWREQEQTAGPSSRPRRSERQLARRAVDEMYTEVAEKWLAQEPKLTPLQREFLEKALAFYQRFTQDPGSGPAERHAAAEAAERLGQIQEKLEACRGEGSLPRGLDARRGVVTPHPRRGRIPARARSGVFPPRTPALGHRSSPRGGGPVPSRRHRRPGTPGGGQSGQARLPDGPRRELRRPGVGAGTGRCDRPTPSRQSVGPWNSRNPWFASPVHVPKTASELAKILQNAAIRRMIRAG